MGLDQYLFSRTANDENGEKERQDIGYWRKFNALQKWMTDRYSDGIDEQENLLLDEDGIGDLVDVLQGVYDRAKESGAYGADGCTCVDGFEANDRLIAYCDDIFPAEDGFFFGSTDYDESYFENVAEALETFNGLLNRWDDKLEYYYGSWW